MALKIAPLFSGSSGNCIFVKTDETSILIDAGVSCKSITEELASIGEDIRDVSAVLVTHEHIDHIKGIDVLMRKYDIPVYANEKTLCAIESKLKDPSLKHMRIIDENDFYIDDLCIQPFSISHDAADPFGYSVFGENKKVTVMTDLGKVTQSVLDAAKGSSIVLLESNHDVDMLGAGKYPYHLKRRILSAKGHLSNETAAKTALELVKNGTRGIVLGHLSINNNVESLAYATVAGYLQQCGVTIGKHVGLIMAKRHCATGIFEAK